MGTKTQSSSSGNQATSFQFNPQSMKQYQQLLSAWSPAAQGFINNPYGNPQYQLEQGMGQAAANTMGQRGVGNVMGNFRAMGSGNMPGFQTALLNAASRGTASLQAGQWQNAFLNAGRRQQASMGLAASFQPLMTGSNSNFANQSQTQTSGLGTWLPQVAGMAMSGAMMGMGAAGVGGGSGGIGGSGIGGGAAVNQATSPFSSSTMNPFSASNNGIFNNMSNGVFGSQPGYAPQANSGYIPGMF